MAKTSNVRTLRKRIGLNQRDFWSRVGVTQSGGSRYESGRAMPKPVRMLVAVAYGNRRECEGALKRLIPAFKGMQP